MDTMKIYAMSFSRVYPLYINKVERKGKTKKEVNEIIYWLTGYNDEALNEVLIKDINLETFFKNAPNFNKNASLIKGVICGYRVEEIEDEIIQKVRYLDKLIDELAKGKQMSKILRSS